jgi:hypothetical protein
VVQHEGDCELDERQPRLIGELGELLDGVEVALVVRVREVKALGEPTGA